MSGNKSLYVCIKEVFQLWVQPWFLLQNTKKLCRAMVQCFPMTTCNCYSCSDLITAGEFEQEVSDHPPYSPHLASSHCHPLTYLKNWLSSQPSNNIVLMEGSQLADSFDTNMHDLVPQFRQWPHWEVAHICISFLYTFLSWCFVISSPNVTFWIVLLLWHCIWA